MIHNFYKTSKRLAALVILGCLSNASMAQVVHLSQNFNGTSGTTPPSGWSQNQIQGATTDLWNFSNPGGRTIGSPMSSPAAIFDSDFLATFVDEDVALESPAVNTTGYTTVKLKWDQFFAGIYNNGFDGIYVEVYNGTSWVTVYSNTNLAYPGSASSQDIDVSAQAANRTGVKVRCRFVGNYSWWWIVDNIQLYTPVVDVYPTSVGLTKGVLCGDAAEQVVVRVYNASPSTQTNIPVTVNYTGTSSGTLTGTITRTIAVNASDTIIFPTTFNTIPGYNFNFQAYTALGADIVRTNDTLTDTETIIGTPSKPTITPASRCGNGTITLSATPGNVADSIYWFASGTGTTPLGTGTSLTTPYLSGSTMFWASASRGGLKDSIQTTYAAGNGQNGAMFDIISNKGLTIDSFQYLSQTTGSTTIEVYYRVGTYVGYETNASAWTSLGTQTINAVAGTNRVTVSPLNISANQTYGIYFRTTGTLSYTNGSNTYSNSSLTLTAGVGVSGTFAGTFNPRTWNGTLYYGGGCMSTRDSATATVNPLGVGANLLQGTTFQGHYNAGTYGDADNTLKGNTVMYAVNPPTGYTNAGYGTTWSVSSNSVKTSNGTNFAGSVNYAAPASGNNATLTLVADSADIDSMYEVSITVRLLSTGCDTVITRVIYIATIPTPGFGSSSACFGSNTNFYDSSSTIRGGLRYFWDFGDAGAADTSVMKNPVYAFSGPGTFTVTQTITNDYGYSASSTKIVTVGYIPNTNFTVVNKCQGDSTVFTNTTTINGPQVALTYLWDFGDANNSVATSPKWKYGAIGVYNVSLTATTPIGCKTTLTKVTTVFAKPVADFTAQMVCAGVVNTFANNSTLAQGMLGSEWTFGDGTSSTAPSPGHVYDNGGTYNVKLIAYSNFGCLDSITKSVTIKPRPAVSFTTNGSCHGDSIGFINGSTFSAGGFTSEWDFGTGVYNSNNSASFKHKYSAPGTYRIKLKATGDGCSNETESDLVVNESPTPDFSINSVVCKNTNIDLTNNTSGSGTLTYNWNFGDNTNSADMNPAKSYAATGNYTITLMVSSTNGCISASTMPVKVNDLPVATYTYTKIDPMARQVQFTPTTNSLTSAYLWEYGDGNSSNQVSPVYSYLSNGPFMAMLTITDSIGCKNTSNQTVGFNVSAGKVKAGNYQFEVYPNPFRSATTVGFAITKTSEVQVVVLDITGKQVAVLVNETKTAGAYKVNLDASQYNLGAGTYFIRLSVDGNVQNKQIVQVK